MLNAIINTYVMGKIFMSFNDELHFHINWSKDEWNDNVNWFHPRNPSTYIKFVSLDKMQTWTYNKYRSIFSNRLKEQVLIQQIKEHYRSNILQM